MSPERKTLTIFVRGGLEHSFDSDKKLKVTLPASMYSAGDLVKHIKYNHVTKHSESFTPRD